jgi:hypothetical protein
MDPALRALVNLTVWIALGALVGYKLGDGLKGRGRAGAWLGGLLFFFGWIAVLLLDDHRPKCPECRSAIAPGARRCAKCGTQLSTAQVAG